MPTMEASIALLQKAFAGYMAKRMDQERWPDDVRQAWFPWVLQDEKGRTPHERFFQSSVMEMTVLQVDETMVEWWARPRAHARNTRH